MKKNMERVSCDTNSFMMEVKLRSAHGVLVSVMLSFSEHILSIGEYQPIVPWDPDVLVHDERVI